ncbi:MAG: hypothetical protein M3552_10225, partial [Planctomycetota bacterium]|nr:hypothetical protein [Planctomycetota bacterium]
QAAESTSDDHDAWPSHRFRINDCRGGSAGEISVDSTFHATSVTSIAESSLGELPRTIRIDGKMSTTAAQRLIAGSLRSAFA